MPGTSPINRTPDCAKLLPVEDALPAIVAYAEPMNVQAANVVAAIHLPPCGGRTPALAAVDSDGHPVPLRTGLVETGGGRWELGVLPDSLDGKPVAWLGVPDDGARGDPIVAVPPVHFHVDFAPPAFVGRVVKWSARPNSAGGRDITLALPRITDDASNTFLLLAWDGESVAGRPPDGVAVVHGEHPAVVLAGGERAMFTLMLMDSAGNVGGLSLLTVPDAGSRGKATLRSAPEGPDRPTRIEDIIDLAPVPAPATLRVACGVAADMASLPLLRSNATEFPANATFALPAETLATAGYRILANGEERRGHASVLHTSAGPYLLVEPEVALPTEGTVTLSGPREEELRVRGTLGRPDLRPPILPKVLSYAVLEAPDPRFFAGRRILLRFDGLADDVWRTLRAKVWISDDGASPDVSSAPWTTEFVDTGAASSYMFVGARNLCDPRAASLAEFATDPVTVAIRFVDGSGNATPTVQFRLDLSRTMDPHARREHWRRARPVPAARPKE